MPESRPFLTASWRYLAMLNYEVPPALLRPLVPPGTELDTWNGASLASVSAFGSSTLVSSESRFRGTATSTR